jgi:hypothetical protein
MDRFNDDVKKCVTDGDLEAASQVADKVLENAQNFVSRRILRRPPPFEEEDSPYMQLLLAQHVKVQTAFLSTVKWNYGLDVNVTHCNQMEVEAKLQIDPNVPHGNLDVNVYK